jgi:signal transduction histidine kinase
MAWIAGPAVWITEFVIAIGVLIVDVVRVPDHGWLPWFAGTTFAVVACIAAQHERRLAEQLRAAQGGLAERARAEERNRIAHEIHDAVAHALTVSVLHISSARLALDDDLVEARRLMAEAEEQGRVALTEVRQAVGMLRQDGEVADLLPNAGQLAQLVDTVRGAGATVELETSGPIDKLPNTTGFVLYRILQEALTNSVRHAPGAATRCSLTVDPGRVELTVDTLRPASGAQAGTGLAGMRARAEALGGTCSAGPHEDTWRVRAVLPLHALSAP